MSLLTDEELVAHCKKELPYDTRNYEELVQRYMSRVYSIVYRVVLNKEEAEDITQEVFVKVYNGVKKFEQQALFSSWLYRIATNSALDALDKNKRHSKYIAPLSKTNATSSHEEMNALHLQASTEAGPEEKVIQTELRDCINRVLQKLDREQARLLLMRDFNDLSYDEIAKSLEAGLSAVKMRIHRARLSFQEIFSQFCGRTSPAFSVSSGNGAKDKVKTK
ncbi:MAG: sigma-70 family RNA polymerase sigma factor [Ktedonobacteraceae bacterium]